METEIVPVISVVQTGYSFGDIANFAIAIGIIIAGGLSVFYIFMGGLSFILSGGQEDKIKEAVHTIRYAIIGLVVTIFAVTIIGILGSIFDINLISYLKWETILEMMQGIIDRVVNQGASTGGPTL